MNDIITAVAVAGIAICVFIDLAYVVALILRAHEDDYLDDDDTNN